MKYLIVAILIILAVFLFLDASTFFFYPANPVTGRSRSCYTIVESLVGVKHPSVIRNVELTTASVLLLSIVIIIRSYWLKRIIRKYNEPIQTE